MVEWQIGTVPPLVSRLANLICSNEAIILTTFLHCVCEMQRGGLDQGELSQSLTRIV